MVLYNALVETTTPVKDKVRQLRRERGLLQEELAERAGVSTQTIRNVEAGRYNAKMETLVRIARALGVSVGELFG